MPMQQTSLSAFVEVMDNLGDRQLQVYRTLRNLKEANNLMIAKKLNLPINSITPRVLELRKMGLVVESYRDVCPLTKRMTIFWRCK